MALNLCVDAAETRPGKALADAKYAPTPNRAVSGAEQAGTTIGDCCAIYICLGTSKKLVKTVERIQQMVEARLLLQPQQELQETNNRGGVGANDAATINNYYQSSSTWQACLQQQQQEWMKRILTKTVVNQDDLLDLVCRELPDRLLEEPNVRVVVLDSIADLFRTSEDSSASFATRSAVLFQLAARLKEISCQFRVPIVVVNQVTASISTTANASTAKATLSSWNGTNTSRLLPALGLSWAHCVNQSFLLSRQPQVAPDDTCADNNTNNCRRIKLHQSSQHPRGQTATFRIQETGVILLD